MRNRTAEEGSILKIIAEFAAGHDDERSSGKMLRLTVAEIALQC